MEKLISIIIINYNSYSYTFECLKSLRNQTYKNFEVLLVDNGSKYDLFLKMKEKLNQFNNILNIKLIRNIINLYFGAGNNKAIKEAKGEYICLLNNDTEVLPDFIEKMVDFLEKHPGAGMISPKIKLYPQKQYIWNAGNHINFKTSIVATNRGYLEFDPNDLKYSEIELNDFAAGTALFIKKKYLEKIGLIDEIYFMYWEDPDWNFRAKELGYESYYVPTTIVYHKIPVNEKISAKRQIFNDYFFKRNKQIFVWKFASIKELIIFYFKFSLAILSEFLKKLWYRAFAILIINIISIWHGFRIGLKRRTHRSCRKYLIKDYFYIKKLQKF